jgi:hypothetical protein
VGVNQTSRQQVSCVRSPPNPTNTTPTNRQTLLTSSGKTR